MLTRQLGSHEPEDNEDCVECHIRKSSVRISLLVPVPLRHTTLCLMVAPCASLTLMLYGCWLLAAAASLRVPPGQCQHLSGLRVGLHVLLPRRVPRNLTPTVSPLSRYLSSPSYRHSYRYWASDEVVPKIIASWRVFTRNSARNICHGVPKGSPLALTRSRLISGNGNSVGGPHGSASRDQSE
jgi:hypothetical protein